MSKVKIFILLLLASLVLLGFTIPALMYFDIKEGRTEPIIYPNKTIRSWQKKANKMIILYKTDSINAGSKDDKQLIINDKKEIDSWLDLISSEPRATDDINYCNCTGNPWLKLYYDDKYIATISIHLCTSIRSEQLGKGNFDLDFMNKEKLEKKCAGLGIEDYLD
jgi:hypothetical protein